jgi:glycosyltransferase involved in cell wall biosynthesis
LVREKTHVLYNPVDSEKYAGGDASKVIAEVEAALGRKIRRGRTLVVTQVAAITKNKRQDCFVKVMAALKETGTDAVGLLLGDAISQKDQAYKEQILSEIKERGLERDIHMPGFRRDIPDFLDLSDCVLIPSEEGLPLAAMEALCARRRVVASSSGGAYELLLAAGCGTFYDAGAGDAVIADAVRRAMAEQGSAEIESGYRFCRKQSTASYQKRFVELCLDFPGDRRIHWRAVPSWLKKRERTS